MKKLFGIKEITAALALVMALAAIYHLGSPGGVGRDMAVEVDASSQATRVLRVLALDHERMTGALTPFGPGLEAELLQSFGRGAGYRVSIKEISSPQAAWKALADGDADLFIGLGMEPPKSIGGPIVAGPAYAHFRPVLVHSNKRHPLRSKAELGRVPILLTASPVLKKSLALEAKGLPGAPMAHARKDYELTPILNSLNENQARFALVDEGRFQLLQPFFPGVRPTRSLDREIPYRWFWSSTDPELSEALGSFWQYHETETKLARLTERYFGFLPEETDYYELWDFSKAIEERLPAFRKAIERAAAKNRIDPLLLTAIIYQESRFDPEARSKTNVRGLMQITQVTAELLGLSDRTDPVQSIKGGARYLRQLWEGLESMDLDPWDRWFFALAAYNQGPGHLSDAVRLARSLGGKGTTWGELKKAFPLLSWEKYFSQAKHGYCRGREAVDYVDSIRYYYYILHGIVALSRPEAEHLRPLLGAVRSVAPGA